VIDVMTRLKVHHMSEGGVPQAVVAERCGVGLRSVERILAEAVPTLEEVAAGQLAAGPRRGRPPKASDDLIGEICHWLADEPHIFATEVHRRAVQKGYTGSPSAMSALVKKLRPPPSAEPVVRFEGLPGEYAQFDFGEAHVTYEDGRTDKIVFFAGRLKYSRMMHVVIVPDQQAETLVRALIACLVAFGGSPKEWVFDNPRTIRLSKIGVEPIILHPYLRDLVAEYRVIPTFCTPRRGNQKGSVERLVGFAKHSFFFARKFQDRADVERQLDEWLRDVDYVRPCDATGVVPAVALVEEKPWLDERPVRQAPHEHALVATATVTPMGTVSHAGTSYFATARRLGAPATLLVRRDTIEVIVGTERSTHRRQDGTGEVHRLPHQRQDMLGVIHGRRKVATFRRQCLIELGGPAWSFLGVLVHRCPQGRWEQPCTELFELLRDHGDDALRDAFQECVANKRFEVEDVRRALGVA
jgi:transposase